VGLYKLQVESSLTHSLKAPGFNPRAAYEVKTRFQNLGFQTQLAPLTVRYPTAAAAADSAPAQYPALVWGVGAWVGMCTALNDAHWSAPYV
jgi:hypothetical protein